MTALAAPLWALSGHLREHRPLFARVVVVSWLLLMAGVATSVLTVLAVSAVVTGDDSAPLLVGLTTATVLTLGALTWVDSWLSHVLAYRVIDTVRLAVHSALAGLAPLGLGRRRSGETAATAMADAEALEWFYAHTAAQFVAGLLAAAAVSVSAFAWFGWPALILVAGQILVVATARPALTIAKRQGAALRTSIGALSAEAVEARQAARELVLLDLVPRHRTRLHEATVAVQRVRRSQAVRTGAEQASLELVGALTAVLGLTGLLAVVDARGLAGDQFPAAVAVMTAGLAPCILVATGLQRVGEMSAAAARLDEVITADPGRHATPPTTAPVPWYDGAGGRLEVHGLRFSYPDTGHEVLRRVDLTVAPGEHLALVGASGAGKTTLLHLLVRLIEPDEGSIRIDGADITDTTPEATRRRVNVVAQHPHIFRTTLRENLLIAAPGRSDEELVLALNRAGLTDHLAALPDGLDTVLAEHGATWSGGQRQRLGLARGLLLDPDVLVLDEPTANLDPTAEQAFLDTLTEVRSRATTIVVSHRESTLLRLPRVAFLDGGRIVAEGTHDSLLAEHSHYRAVLASGEEAETDEIERR